MLYSRSRNGFYCQSIHQGSLPEDAIEITDEVYRRLLLAQESGAEIQPDENGNPVGILRETSSLETATIKFNDNVTVAITQISVLQPAVDGGYAKPEHSQLLADWQRYRYELTLVPGQPGWPESPQWPDQPEAII